MRWSDGSRVLPSPAVARPRRATLLFGVRESLLWMVSVAVFTPSEVPDVAENVSRSDVDCPGSSVNGIVRPVVAENLLFSVPLLTSAPAGIVSGPAPFFFRETLIV